MAYLDILSNKKEKKKSAARVRAHAYNPIAHFNPSLDARFILRKCDAQAISAKSLAS